MTVQKTGRNDAMQLLDAVSKVSGDNGKNFQKVMSKAFHSNISDSHNGMMNASKSNSDKIVTNKSNFARKEDARTVLAETKKTTVSSQKNNANVATETKNAITSIKDKVKDVLGVSDEEIEEAMSALGLTQAQLFQPQNLMLLLQKLTGVQDTMDILTNAQLSQDFKEIMDFAEKTLQMLTDTYNVAIEEVPNLVMDDSSKGITDDASNEEFTLEKKTEMNSSAVLEKETASQVAEDDATGVNQLSKALDEKLEVHAENSKQGENQLEQKNNTSDNQQVTTEFSQTLSQNIQNSFEQIVQTTTEKVNGTDIVRQVVQAVRLNLTSSIQSLEIQLNPEHLGKLNLTVSAKNGIITAEIVAQNEQVKKALETQIVSLKENFENQGIKVEAVEVTVQSHFFENGQNLKGNNSEQQKNAKGSRRFINIDDIEDFDDVDEDESFVKNENSSVEYTA